MEFSRARLRRTLRIAGLFGPRGIVALAQVTVIAVFVELALRRVAVDRLAGWLGVNLRLSGHPTVGPTSLTACNFRPEELRKARLARRLLRYWPFGQGPCLRESLVVGHALRRHCPVLRLGVARDGQSIAAHAWLEVGGVSLEADQGFLPLGD